MRNMGILRSSFRFAHPAGSGRKETPAFRLEPEGNGPTAAAPAARGALEEVIHAAPRHPGFTLMEPLVVIAFVFVDGHAKYKRFTALKSGDFGLVPGDDTAPDRGSGHNGVCGKTYATQF